jgi:hypothetical protein
VQTLLGGVKVFPLCLFESCALCESAWRWRRATRNEGRPKKERLCERSFDDGRCNAMHCVYFHLHTDFEPIRRRIEAYFASLHAAGDLRRESESIALSSTVGETDLTMRDLSSCRLSAFAGARKRADERS